MHEFGKSYFHVIEAIKPLLENGMLYAEPCT